MYPLNNSRPTLFNPPPSTKPGGTHSPHTSSGSHSGFNPPPSTKPGGTEAPQIHTRPVQPVSIHRPARSRAERADQAAPAPSDTGFQSTAQHEAGRNRLRVTASRYCPGFNPPPSTKPGGTEEGEPLLRVALVSIHRPARSRAERVRFSTGCPPSWRFNPPPSTKPGGTAYPLRSSSRVRCFNPPPSTKPGGTRRCSRRGTSCASFNPPPSTKPGGTHGRTRRGRGPIVSIHRPARSRAERRGGLRFTASRRFQSTAQHEAGRNKLQTGERDAYPPLFQSTAQHEAGRNAAAQARGQAQGVSIHRPARSRAELRGVSAGEVYPVSIHRPARSRAELVFEGER